MARKKIVLVIVEGASDARGFVEFICSSEFSVNGDFKASWDYIEKDMNSINRYSNFSICIKEELLAQQIKKESK